MTDLPPKPKPSRTNPWRVVFALSVALNLGVLFLGIGAALHDLHGPRGDMVRDMGFGPFTEALRPKDRKDLRDAVLAKMPDFKAQRDQMRGDAQAVLTALRATPYDPAQLQAAMAGMQDHLSQRMDLGRAAMENFLSSLSAQDRIDFATRLEASLGHGPESGSAAGSGAGN